VNPSRREIINRLLASVPAISLTSLLAPGCRTEGPDPIGGGPTATPAGLQLDVAKLEATYSAIFAGTPFAELIPENWGASIEAELELMRGAGLEATADLTSDFLAGMVGGVGDFVVAGLQHADDSEFDYAATNRTVLAGFGGVGVAANRHLEGSLSELETFFGGDTYPANPEVAGWLGEMEVKMRTFAFEQGRANHGVPNALLGFMHELRRGGGGGSLSGTLRPAGETLKSFSFLTEVDDDSTESAERPGSDAPRDAFDDLCYVMEIADFVTGFAQAMHKTVGAGANAYQTATSGMFSTVGQRHELPFMEWLAEEFGPILFNAMASLIFGYDPEHMEHFLNTHYPEDRELDPAGCNTMAGVVITTIALFEFFQSGMGWGKVYISLISALSPMKFSGTGGIILAVFYLVLALFIYVLFMACSAMSIASGIAMLDGDCND